MQALLDLGNRLLQQLHLVYREFRVLRPAQRDTSMVLGPHSGRILAFSKAFFRRDVPISWA
jgi:hypothetical protein